MTSSLPIFLVVALLVGAAAAILDLTRKEASTIVIYTTPALKDLLEKDIIPRYQSATGERVEPVYVAAGEEYNRLLLSGTRPEADVFLHASPLYIEKGYASGYFVPFTLPYGRGDVTFASRSVEGDGLLWAAFAWSPLVEVYAPKLGDAPDLASPTLRFGLAEPMLSNNGIYTALYFETVDPAAGRQAVAQTTLQPVNAAATISGITDDSFDLTLGYEAVALLYQGKGAAIEFALPRLHGEQRVLPVVMTAGLVAHHPHAEAERFIRFLFTEEMQTRLPRYHLRAIDPSSPAPEGGLDLSGVERIDPDWSTWSRLEAKLPDYVVRR